MTKISARWLAIGVLFAWTLLPAIACAADMRQMTKPEMACCKKMAGKCDMGVGQHSCCDQAVHAQDPSKAVLTEAFQLPDSLPACNTPAIADVGLPRAAHAQVIEYDGSPPESPPDSINILRI